MVKVTSTEVKIDHGINGVARQKDVQKLQKDLRQLLIFLDSQSVIKMDDWFDFYGRANEDKSTPSGSGE